MKRSLKKIISFALMLSLLVGMMAGFNVFAAEEAPTVEIVSKNVYYADDLKLMYGVKATGDYDTMVVKVYNSANVEGTEPAETITEHYTDTGKDFEVFISKDGVPAQNIDTELYAVAELYKGETKVANSTTIRYSVLEYLYERLVVSTNVTTSQKAMYKNLLSYADSLDVLLNEEAGNADADTIADYSYVRVEGGTVDGTNIAGMYKVGTKLSELGLTTNYVIQEAGNVLAWEITEYDKDRKEGTVTEVRATESDVYSLTSNSIIIKPTEKVAVAVKTTGTLVTDISQLTDGAKIFIVASGYDVAMSTTQNPNNRGQVEITKDGNTISFDDTVSVQVITVEKVGDVYYLNVGIDEDGESLYLYAAGGTGSNNWLRTQAKSDVCQWTIEISEEGVATIKATDTTIVRNWIRYNKASNSLLFSCYASGQQDISIYVVN